MDYDSLFDAATYHLADGISVFAGTVDDPFFIDLGAAFDTINFRTLASGVPGVLTPAEDAANENFASDTVSGYAVNTIALEVPITMLTSTGRVEPASAPCATIGVWGTTSRPRVTIRQSLNPAASFGPFRQVQRFGNPLINELVIGIGSKDRWSMEKPVNDSQFAHFDLDPPDRPHRGGTVWRGLGDSSSTSKRPASAGDVCAAHRGQGNSRWTDRRFASAQHRRSRNTSSASQPARFDWRRSRRLSKWTPFNGRRSRHHASRGGRGHLGLRLQQIPQQSSGRRSQCERRAFSDAIPVLGGLPERPQSASHRSRRTRRRTHLVVLNLRAARHVRAALSSCSKLTEKTMKTFGWIVLSLLLASEIYAQTAPNTSHARSTEDRLGRSGHQSASRPQPAV